MFLYLIKQSDTNLYKIGISKAPGVRLKQLQTANGVPLEIIKTFQTEFGFKLESTIQKIFSHKKTLGEWFNLDNKDVFQFEETCRKRESIFKNLEKENEYFKTRFL